MARSVITWHAFIHGGLAVQYSTDNLNDDVTISHHHDASHGHQDQPEDHHDGSELLVVHVYPVGTNHRGTTVRAPFEPGSKLRPPLPVNIIDDHRSGAVALQVPVQIRQRMGHRNLHSMVLGFTELSSQPTT